MTDRKLDPRALMTDIQGRAYLPVAARVLWARQEHEDWSIITEPVAIGDGGFMRATIMDGAGRILATAHKAIRPGGRGAVGQYPVESAETGAIGRALGLCGYGTLAGDLDEGEDVADAPAQRGAGAPNGHRPQSDAPAPGSGQHAPPQTAQPVHYGPRIEAAQTVAECLAIAREAWKANDGHHTSGALRLAFQRAYALAEYPADLATIDTAWQGAKSRVKATDAKPLPALRAAAAERCVDLGGGDGLDASIAELDAEARASAYD